MKKFFFLLVASVLATTASAQFVNSGSGKSSASGGGISAMSTDDYNRFYVGYIPLNVDLTWWDMPSLKNSLTAGYLHGSSLSSKLPLFIEYGANFQYTFGKDKSSDYNDRVNMYSVNIPVNLAFKFQFNDISITPYLGVNFRVNAAGTYKSEWDDGWGDKGSFKANIFDADEMDGMAIKRFQAGLNVGAGFSYKAIYIGVGYIHDFSKFMKYENISGGKASGVTLTLGFNF